MKIFLKSIDNTCKHVLYYKYSKGDEKNADDTERDDKVT